MREEDIRNLPDFARGRVEAEVDIAAGILKHRAHGKLVAWEHGARLLEERYHIHFEIVGACITPLDVAARAMGYNERMQEEILSRFGSDVITATFREADRKAKKRQKKLRGRA